MSAKGRAIHPADAEGFAHVTDVLVEAGLVDLSWFTQESRDRGSAVHAATHYLDEGDLDESSVDPRVLPYVASYRKFLAEVRPVILAIEEPVVNREYRYCGTFDRYCTMNEKSAIIDLKCGGSAPWHAVQLAGYAGCYPDHRDIQRFNLYLSPGGYKFIERADRDDWRVFLACLSVANWKRRHA